MGSTVCILQRLISCAGVILLASCAAPSPPAVAPFDAGPWLADYAMLKTGLEKNYANLMWFAAPESGANLPELDRATLAALRDARSDADAQAALRAFIQRFGDGHLRTLDAALDQPAAPEPERRSLDGLSAEQACGVVAEGASSDAMYSAPFESLAGFRQISSGADQVFRHGVFTSKDGRKIAVLRLQVFRESAYPALCRAVWADLKKANTPITSKAIRDDMPQAWLNALAQAIKTLKVEQPDALLIDLAGNGGGNDAGDWSTRLFSSQPITSPPLFIGAANAPAYLDEQLGNLRRAKEVTPPSRPDLQAVADQALAAYERSKLSVAATTCDLGWVWREQRPWQPTRCGALVQVGYSSGVAPTMPGEDDKLTDYISYFYWPAVATPYQGAWNGKLFILQDNRVASSAEMFTAILQDNRVARVIGTPSRGAGCGNMRKIKPLTLPRSQLRLQMPDCVRLRKDGRSEVTGITPDIRVDLVAGESARARTARVLQAIAAELPARP